MLTYSGTPHLNIKRYGLLRRLELSWDIPSISLNTIQYESTQYNKPLFQWNSIDTTSEWSEWKLINTSKNFTTAQIKFPIKPPSKNIYYILSVELEFKDVVLQSEKEYIQSQLIGTFSPGSFTSEGLKFYYYKTPLETNRVTLNAALKVTPEIMTDRESFNPYVRINNVLSGHVRYRKQMIVECTEGEYRALTQYAEVSWRPHTNALKTVTLVARDNNPLFLNHVLKANTGSSEKILLEQNLSNLGYPVYWQHDIVLKKFNATELEYNTSAYYTYEGNIVFNTVCFLLQNGELLYAHNYPVRYKVGKLFRQKNDSNSWGSANKKDLFFPWKDIR